MNIERMQPADFDAVYRLLTQSFPATERRGAASTGVESEARSAALSAREVIRFIKLFLLVRYSESTFCLVPVYSFLPLRRAV